MPALNWGLRTVHYTGYTTSGQLVYNGKFSFREHDKNPEMFFRVILELDSLGLDFRISVLGERYQDVPGLEVTDFHVVESGLISNC